MKRLLLSLCMAVLAIGMSFASEVTILTNSSASEWTGDGGGYTTTTQGFTISYIKASSSNDLTTPTTSEIRVYKGADLQITNVAGEAITKIVITPSSSSYVKDMAPDSGTVTLDTTDKVIVWEGSSSSVKLSASTAQVRIKSITITYGAAAAVETPKFDPKAGTYYEAQNVTIATATEGASIYYTTDGTDPTAASTAYTAPIAIAQSTTLKAIAIKGSDSSEIATAEYVIKYAQDVASIKDFNALEAGTRVKFTSPLTVSYQNGSNLFVKDETGYMIVYGYGAPSYDNGAVIPAGVTGTRIDYSGAPELSDIDVTTFKDATSTNEFAPTVVTATELANATDKTAYLFSYVIVKGGVVSGINNKNATLTDATGSIALYNTFSGVTLPTDSASYDVTAIVALYKSDLQLYPISFESATTGLAQTLSSATAVVGGYSQIEISAAEGGQLLVVNPLGQTVVMRNISAGNAVVSVAPGVYIVKVNNAVRKVVVR